MEESALFTLLNSGVFGNLNDPEDKVTEPVCIILGYESSLGIFGAPVNLNALEDTFKAEGIHAVRYDKEEAEDISATILTPTGLQTPFISPDNVKPSALKLARLINQSQEVNLSSYGASKTINQMTHPAKKVENFQELLNDFPNLKYYANHPNLVKAAEIFKKFGKNFDKEILQDALHKGKKDNLKDEIYYSFNKLYRGAAFGKPYLIDNENEKNCFCYSSFFKDVAINHPIPLLRIDENSQGSYGFIQMYNSHQNNISTENFGLEQGIIGDRFINHETPIVPHYNKFEDIYINIRNNNEHLFIKLDNIPEFKAFRELHLPSMHPNYPVEIQRRKNQLRQARENGGYPFTFQLDGTRDTLNKDNSVNYISRPDILKLRGVSLTSSFNSPSSERPPKKDRDNVESLKAVPGNIKTDQKPKKKSSFGRYLKIISGRLFQKTKRSVKTTLSQNLFNRKNNNQRN